MELRSRVTAPSAASMPPQEGESRASTEPTISPGSPILSLQVTASEALRIMDAPEIEDTELLAIADTLISLRSQPDVDFGQFKRLLKSFLFGEIAAHL